MTEAGRSLKTVLVVQCRVDVNRETSISSETEKGTWIEVVWNVTGTACIHSTWLRLSLSCLSDMKDTYTDTFTCIRTCNAYMCVGLGQKDLVLFL